MKKFVWLVLLLVVALSLTACGGSTVKLSTNPTVRADEIQAQKIVKGCMQKADFITKSGRKQFENCIAPPGHKLAFEHCATKAVAKYGFLTKHERLNVENALTICVVNNR